MSKENVNRINEGVESSSSYSVVTSPTKPFSIVLKRTPLKEMKLEGLVESPGRKVGRAKKSLDTTELNGKYWSDIKDLPSKRTRSWRFNHDDDDDDNDDERTPTKKKRRFSLAMTTPPPPSSSSISITPRKAQSDIKSKKRLSELSPILENDVVATPKRRGPVRKLLNGPDTPRTVRRRLRAPSLTPQKLNKTRINEDELIDLSDLENEDEETTLTRLNNKRGSKKNKKEEEEEETMSKTNEEDKSKKLKKKRSTPQKITNDSSDLNRSIKDQVKIRERRNENGLKKPDVTPSKKTDLRRTLSNNTPKKITKEYISNLIDLSDLEDDDDDEYKPSKKEENLSDDDDDDDDFTPKSRKRRTEIKEKICQKKKMTPKVPSRLVPLPSKTNNKIQEAQIRLHVSAVPDSLPCREDEFAEIYGFTEDKISAKTGGCMYISGVPGTGKTATVKEVIRCLKEDFDFTFIEVNGMRLTEPNQAYVQIWKGLDTTDKKARVTSEHAYVMLDKKFSQRRKEEKSVVLLVDELDMLCTARKQNVLYNLFEWPNRPGVNLIVLAIANTMDLPERIMMNRVSSRLGLTRLTFSPYTHHQLQEIVAARLKGLEIFDKDAVQLVSRKVASLSGDARRALDICRRATEIAERRQSGLVGLEDVAEAHREMFCSPKIAAIRCCSRYEKLLLKAIVSEFHRTGIEEATFQRCFGEFNTLCHYDGVPTLTETQTFELCFRLSASKLILAEHGSRALDLRIRLNVSIDDVSFALQEKK